MFKSFAIAALVSATSAQEKCTYGNQKECDADAGCAWCKSAAVPSSCNTLEDAKRLPAGVFICDKVGEELTEVRAEPDPKKEYFQKIGAEFAAAFLYGSKVGGFDEIDLFQCLEREPEALHFFYQADEKLKDSLHRKDPYEGIYGLKELIGFIAIMANEHVPGRDRKLCYELEKDGDWEGYERIIRDLQNPETDLAFADGHIFFNHQDITQEGQIMGEDYIKGDFKGLGYRLGSTLEQASHHHPHEDKDLFLF